MARRRNFPRAQRASLARVVETFGGAILALAMPAIILGGIVGGVVTPTEAGSVAVVYAAAIGLFVYSDLRWRDLLGIVTESAVNSGIILLMVAASGIFSWLVANLALGQTLVDFFTALTDSRWVMLLVINVFFLIWGLALEPAVALVTLVPLLVPVANAYGIDLVQLGVVVVLNLMIGQLTPPSGVITFLTAQIAGAPLERVFREAWPFTVALIGVLAMVTYIPSLALWLPDLLMGK